jgi:glycosyltransferase involved in cell wall biosynthesis
MRILIAHSRYRSGELSGENRVVLEEAELLREAGHVVDVFAPSPDGISRGGLAARTLASHGAAAEVRDRVRAERIEVVHCHNLYPTLGPWIIPAAAKAGAAVVMTLHNYRLMCLAGTFFRDGHVCEDCFTKQPWPGVKHACYRASHPESAVLGASVALARARRTYGHVHRFLAVSEFVRAKHIAAGLAAGRIVVKPNVVGPQLRRTGPGDYFLVLSRFSEEKGVVQIVSAWSEELGTLRVIGEGPERPEIERLARRGVRVEDPIAPTDVPRIIAGARALIVPSRCFEGQPRAILEAYAAGVPVIASAIGGIPELVVEGETGFTVAPGDAPGWRDAVSRLSSDDVSLHLGEAAYRLWDDRFSPARGCALLEAAYQQAREERVRSG